MSETVNIAAKAICEAVFGPYEQAEADRSEYSISGQSVIAAKAVLEALRSPPASVIVAIEEKARERYEAAPYMQRWYGEDVWQAGIDEGLK